MAVCLEEIKLPFLCFTCPSSIQLCCAEININFRQLWRNSCRPWYQYCCWSEEPVIWPNMWIAVKERSVSVWPPLRAKYLASSTWEPSQKQGLFHSSPGSWSSAFLPRIPDWQNSSVVDWPRTWKSGGWELTWYHLGRLRLRQSKCLASAFWPSHASPSKQSFVLRFSWEKNFLLPFCKEDNSWRTRLSNGFFGFWGMRKLPSYQVYLHFKPISLQQMSSQSMTCF